ncbi:TetR/AcrR family transcriptional regulator [Paraburkholderia sp.]|uniref:TetR/AcrR family transcriptional regulator n=1 Tax=Paraburkholderia sp. TaxID=1926495 RepID=UPI003D6DADC8
MLDTATRLFSEQGVGFTTIAQIAAAAGVTSAMVHYYFTNRDTLLDAIVDERLAPTVQFVWGPVTEASSDDPFEMVDAHIGRLFVIAEQMPWLPSLWMQDNLCEGGLLHKRMEKHLPFEKSALFIKLIKRAQRKGIVNRKIDALLLVNSLFTLVMTPLATSQFAGRFPGATTVTRPMLERHVKALVTGGMRPLDAGPRR